MTLTRSWLRYGTTCLMAVFPLISGRAEAVDNASDGTAVQRLLDHLEVNHTVLLGTPRVSGEFNQTARNFGLHRTGPLSRDFSIKMVWAPERERALFAGANHGVPHRLNDVWEFDLPTLTWHLLYAPDNNRSYGGLGDDPSDVLFQDGLLVTKRGGPAIIGHTWWGITYDTKRHRILFMNTWVSEQDKLVEKMGGDPSQRYKGPPLWTFYPETGKWGFEKAPRPWPRTPFASALEYVPSLDAAIWHANDWEMRATWHYDAEKKLWKDLRANESTKDFNKQCPPQEQVAYLDPLRKLIVAHSEKITAHFEIERSHWTRVSESADTNDEIPTGHDTRTGFFYDPQSGEGLLIEPRTGKIWSYNPDTRVWRKLAPQGPYLPPGERRLSYLDPARNVLVVIQSDAVWAYRYRATQRNGARSDVRKKQTHIVAHPDGGRGS